jgi:RNA methyltransferase, TrmH family
VPQKTISSRDNPLYKELKRLASSSQARRRAQRTLLDGVHLCKAYLEHVGPPLICIAGDSGAAHPEAAEILRAAEAAGAKCMRFSDALFAPLGQVEHGGCTVSTLRDDGYGICITARWLARPR